MQPQAWRLIRKSKRLINRGRPVDVLAHNNHLRGRYLRLTRLFYIWNFVGYCQCLSSFPTCPATPFVPSSLLYPLHNLLLRMCSHAGCACASAEAGPPAFRAVLTAYSFKNSELLSNSSRT